MEAMRGGRSVLAWAALAVLACKADPIADLRAGKADAVEQALARGKLRADGVDASGKPLLVLAWEADRPGVGKVLLDRGADPNLLRPGGRPFVHEVIASGKAAWIDAFLSSHLLDVDAIDGEGLTPLMVAVNHGNREAARALLARGVDLSVLTPQGYAAAHLDLASKAATPVGLAALTTELRCDDFPEPAEVAKAFAAAAANDVAGLKAYVGATRCPSRRTGAGDEQGRTLLLAAVAAGAVDAAHFLLDHGASAREARFTDGRFEAALDLARAPAMQALLRAHGARPPPERKAEVIIAAGAKTPGELDDELAAWTERRLPLDAGFPQVFPSDRLPGLNPGWHVLVLGICEEGVGRTWAAACRSMQRDVYVRTVTVRADRLRCPWSAEPWDMLQPARAETPEGTLVARSLERTVSVELRSASGELVDWKHMDLPGGDEAHPLPCDGLEVKADGPTIRASYTCYTPYCTTPSATDMGTVFRVEKGKIRSREYEGEHRRGECDR